MSKNIDKIYQVFTNNLSNYSFKDNFIHLRKSSDEGFVFLKNLNLKIDFCYIDGSHLYKNIKNDYTNYSSLLRKINNYTGLISGDDYEYTFDEIVELSSKTETELLSYLNKLKEIDYTTLEIAKDKVISFHPGIAFFLKKLMIQLQNLNLVFG